jgi:hypothetical protein
MINKRLLIKNLLAHNNENTFFDKKLKIDIGSREGKGKLLKHICALANSNPKNNSFIVVGVKDEDNDIVGVDFFDDSKIQNLINAYITNPPIITYENVPFPHLPEDKVVGLITIKPVEGLTSLRKNIWKYYGGAVFFRDGSISMPKEVEVLIKDVNSETVKAIENNSQNNIELTLNGVFDFFKFRQEVNPQYKVFKEYFVVCWAGLEKKVKDETFYSRVDIELVNEQVRLFFSALDEVSIEITEEAFKIIEYVNLGLQNENKYVKLEETIISFNANGSYNILSELLFKSPEYDKKLLHHIYNSNHSVLKKVSQKRTLNSQEFTDYKNVPITYVIAYFNGFEDALDRLDLAKPIFKSYSEDVYTIYKQALRIARKIKYN